MRKTPVLLTLCLAALLATSPLLAVEVTGKVVDCEYEGVGLVEVRFVAEAGGEPVATGWTDDYGIFRLDVEPGTYLAVVTDGEAELAPPTPIRVDPEGDLEPPTVRGESGCE